LAFREFALRVRLLANYFRRSPAPAERKRQPSRLISDRLLFTEESVLPKCGWYVKKKRRDPVRIQSLSPFFFGSKVEAPKTASPEKAKSGECRPLVSNPFDDVGFGKN
jgi:hypothetical protein